MRRIDWLVRDWESSEVSRTKNTAPQISGWVSVLGNNAEPLCSHERSYRQLTLSCDVQVLIKTESVTAEANCKAIWTFSSLNTWEHLKKPESLIFNILGCKLMVLFTVICLQWLRRACSHPLKVRDWGAEVQVKGMTRSVSRGRNAW